MPLFAAMLLAIDGSPTSDAALDVACSLAQAYGGTVTARYVLARDAQLHGRRVDWVPQAEPGKRRAAAAILEDARVKAEREYGVSLHVALVDGDPIEEIIKAANAVAADSIVIGNRGRSALSTLLLGSVAQGVTQQSRLPVLVVHDPQGARNANGATMHATNSG